jgi:hypothetical protein
VLSTTPLAVLVVPTIVLAEAHHMIFRGKTKLVWSDIVRALEMDVRLLPLDLTVDVVARISHELEMHDGIIVATALMLEDAAGEEVRLITRDRRIRDSGLVETVW